MRPEKGVTFQKGAEEAVEPSVDIYKSNQKNELISFAVNQAWIRAEFRLQIRRWETVWARADHK